MAPEVGAVAHHDVPTPDFYRYPWTPPQTVTVEGRFVVLNWPDGATLRAFDWWLAENTLGDAIDLATRESVLDPADITDDWAVAHADVTAEGALAVTWRPGGRRSLFHPGWLRHVADGHHRPDSSLPRPQAWTTDDVSEPPTIDGTHVLDDEAVLLAWLEALVVWGLARLQGVGNDPDFLLALTERIGPIRDTNFGLLWDVKADLQPVSTANTNRRLCPHTDLPTRETPPGFQFLHCVTNNTVGGWSTMTDGLALAQYLAEHEPDHYDALTTLRWVFFNRGEGVDHRWSGPILDLGVPGSPLTVRAFHPVRGFPDMDDGDVPRAYDALRRFSQLAAEPQFQLHFPYAPGDLVGFDNRRVLHGRDRYETQGPEGGHRHLRGVYLDHDDLHSRLRLAHRHRTEPSTQTLQTDQTDQTDQGASDA